MQDSMNDQMCDMVGQSFVLFVCLALAGIISDCDIAKIAAAILGFCWYDGRITILFRGQVFRRPT